MKFKEIQIKKIVVRENVRSEEDGELGDLMDSIDTYGILQPILVRPKGYMFEVVSGHRRFAAMKARNEATIPCMISDEISDSDRVWMQLVENNQRKQMSAFEYVEIFEKLRAADRSMTYTKIGKLIGRNAQWVSRQYDAIKLAGVMVSRGESPTELSSLPASTIVGRAQKEGLTVSGPRRTKDISVSCINSTTLNVRCRDQVVLGRVLQAIDGVRDQIKSEDRAEEELADA